MHIHISFYTLQALGRPSKAAIDFVIEREEEEEEEEEKEEEDDRVTVILEKREQQRNQQPLPFFPRPSHSSNLVGSWWFASLALL